MRQTKRPGLLLLAAFSTFLATGCQDPVQAIMTRNSEMAENVVAENRAFMERVLEENAKREQKLLDLLEGSMDRGDDEPEEGDDPAETEDPGDDGEDDPGYADEDEYGEDEMCSTDDEDDCAEIELRRAHAALGDAEAEEEGFGMEDTVD